MTTRSGLVPEPDGRKSMTADLFRSYLRATRRCRPIVPVRLPGAAARAIRGGANLTSQTLARRTWEEFLADQVGET